eukprot:3851229-Alexandrium_andersonii.AAC.1
MPVPPERDLHFKHLKRCTSSRKDPTPQAMGNATSALRANVWSNYVSAVTIKWLSCRQGKALRGCRVAGRG